MSKYLIRGSYVGAGVTGLLKEGGSSRRKAVEQAVQALGGRLETMYFAFGETDVFAIVELPNNVSAVTASLVSNASGAVTVNFTPLISVEEMDQAAEKARGVGAAYRPPGS